MNNIMAALLQRLSPNVAAVFFFRTNAIDNTQLRPAFSKPCVTARLGHENKDKVQEVLSVSVGFPETACLFYYKVLKFF